MHQGEGERQASVRIVCRKRRQPRDREGPLEPQATYWYCIEDPSSLRLWKELLPCQRPSASGAEQMAPSVPESAIVLFC